MNYSEEIKAMVAYERYKNRERMSPGQKRFLNRVFPEFREIVNALYAKYGKKVNRWNLDWDVYTKDREILRCFRDGDPVRKDDRYALRRIRRRKGMRVPTWHELANYPMSVRTNERRKVEKTLERVRHRPFGRRAVFHHLVKDWTPKRGSFKYWIKGHFGEIIDLLEESLSKPGKRVSYIVTPRLSSGFMKIWLQIREESMSEEEKERKKRLNLEVARMLGSIR